MSRISLFILFPVFFIAELRSQNCSQKLEEAKGSYYMGQLREVETILSGCLENGFTRAEKIEALKLLTNTHLLLTNGEEADNYMQQLLRIDPNHLSREGDLQEFKSLINSYDIISKYTIGITSGVQRPDYLIMRHQSLAGWTEEPADYNEHPGFFMGLTGDYRLISNVYLNLGILYDWRSFEQEEFILNFQRVYSEETQHRLNIPVQLRYIQPLGKWNLFAGGGYSLHYLMKATADFRHVPSTQDFRIPYTGLPYIKENVEITGQHRRFTHNWLGTIGIQRKIANMILELKGSYEVGVSNLIDPDKRYFNPDLYEKYGYVPDDVRVFSTFIGLSAYRNFSVPKKKK